MKPAWRRSSRTDVSARSASEVGRFLDPVEVAGQKAFDVLGKLSVVGGALPLPVFDGREDDGGAALGVSYGKEPAPAPTRLGCRLCLGPCLDLRLPLRLRRRWKGPVAPDFLPEVGHVVFVIRHSS